jgi:hypothetical protein
MANTIKIKSSGLASNVPSSLEYGELALNYADGKIFYKNSSNVIKNITDTYVGTTSVITLGNVTTGTWSANTIQIAYGGTGANSAADARTSLGLAIGSNVQAYSATLNTVSNGTYTGSTSITTVGTLTSGTWSATEIAANKGGTGQTSYATGDILYATSSTVLGKLAVGSANTVLTSSGSIPQWSSSLTLAGDIAVNGGDITTTVTTFNLLNTTATTLNIGGGATTSVNIGNTSGIVNINASKLSINYSSGSEGGELFLAQPASNTTLAGGITIDAFQDRLRFFEQGGGARGYFLDLTSAANGATTAILYNTFTSPSFVTSITTSSSTFSLVNTTATTVNFAGAATTLNMGVTGGTTTISGAVSVGTTLTTGGFVKSSGRFDADDSLSFWIARNNGGTVLFRASTGSTVYADTITGRAVQINSAGTMGTTTSTIRNKKDISDYIFDTEAVLAIKPVRFKYKDEMFSSEEDANKNWQYGFIAEQAYDAGLSEMLGFDDEGLPDYFSYERMCVAQQQVIRELWEKVKTLEEQVGLAT